MTIKHRIEEGLCIISPEGAISGVKSLELGALNKKIISDSTIKVIIFNLAEVDFLDSSGVGTLLFAYKGMLNSSGHFLLCAANSSISALLKNLGLVDIISIYATEEEALASLRRDKLITQN